MDPLIFCSYYLHWWFCSSDLLATVLPPATPGACGSLSSAQLAPVWSAAAAPPLPRPAPSSLFQSGAGAERPAGRFPQERAVSASLHPHELCLLPEAISGISGSLQSPWPRLGCLSGEGAQTGQRLRQGLVQHGVLFWLCVCLRHGHWKLCLHISEQKRMMKGGGVRTANLFRSESVQQRGRKGHRRRKKWVSPPQRQRSKLGKLHTQKIKRITLTNHHPSDSLHFLSIKGQPISPVSCSPHHKAMPVNPPPSPFTQCTMHPTDLTLLLSDEWEATVNIHENHKNWEKCPLNFSLSGVPSLRRSWTSQWQIAVFSPRRTT